MLFVARHVPTQVLMQSYWTRGTPLLPVQHVVEFVQRLLTRPSMVAIRRRTVVVALLKAIGIKL